MSLCSERQDRWSSAIHDLPLFVGALEPPLVTSLHLQQVQLAIAHGCLHQLVAATLVAISCRVIVWKMVRCALLSAEHTTY